MPTPVLALAFANDHDADGRYLPSLAEELRALRQALGTPGAAWRVAERANTTLDDLLDLFDEHAGAVVALHYGGHAAGTGLFLETHDGHPRLAAAGGLARYLGRQPALRIVFLNGCSTLGQVRGLLDAGVPAVIATERPIEDAAATRFATRFYRALAAGATVRAAFDQARGAVEAAGGGASRGPDASDGEDATGSAPEFPWQLHLADGAARVADWHLGVATNDPLFGLPPLPPTDLPPEPFLHLQWFGPQHAPLFFGRGAEIRLLYERVARPDGPPITLLYGQSGAGKSSLLAAGLTPRLRATHLVAYLRRDESSGLGGALRKALGIAAGAPLPADAWRALETRLGKPVVIVIDQLEEAFTRPMAGAFGEPGARSDDDRAGAVDGRVEVGGAPPEISDPAATAADDEMRALYGLPSPPPAPPPPARADELGAFVADLVTLFRDVAARPNGRLVLGFRKEWLAEVRARLSEARLPFGDVFLARLDRAGIVDAVTGPARDPALAEHYRLSLEDDLAAVIADDLLVDPGAPVAPTLQVLLAKLWHAAPVAPDGARRFDRALYQPLKDAGILLGDFLDQQLAALGTTHPDAVASGLALDLLAYHTTPHRTAQTRARAELLAAYPHAADALPALVRRCVDLYLLAVPVDDASGAAPDADATRLAHDTLAALVRDRWRASDRPAQRALRILESRAAEWGGGRDGRLLDDVDLATVEQGAAGMRARTPDEERLVAASRVAARARWAERTLAEAAAADDPVDAARLLAQLADDPEPPNGAAVASRVASRALPIAIVHVTTAPALRGVLALACTESGALVGHGDAWAGRLWTPDDAAAMVGPLPPPAGFVRPAYGGPSAVDDSGRLVALAGGSAVGVWAFGDPATPLLLRLPDDDADPFVTSVAFAGVGDEAYVVATTERAAYVFELGAGDLIARAPGGPLGRAALSPDARWLAVGGYRVAAALYELAEGGPVERLALADADRGVGDLAFGGGGTRLLGKGTREAIHLWTLDALDAPSLPFPGSERATHAAFNPGYHQVVAGCDDGTLRTWFYELDGPPDELHAHDRAITRVLFSPDGELMLTISEDGTARLWEQPLGTEIATLRGHRGTIRGAAFAADGSWVATVGERDAARVWSTSGPAEPLLLRRHQPTDGATSYELESTWRTVHVAPDGGHFAIAAPDGTVRVTPLVGEPDTVTLRYRPADASAPECAALGIADGTVTIVLEDGAVLRAPCDADRALAAAPGGHLVAGVATTRDGRTVAMTYADDVERLVHVFADGRERALRGATRAIYHLALAPDGRVVAATDVEGDLLVWGANDVARCELRGIFGAPTFSPDGSRLFARTADLAHVWRVDPTDGALAVVAEVPLGPAWAFTDDGASLVVGGEDGAVMVYDLAGGALRDLAGHRAAVQSVDVRGGRVLTTARDGSAHVARLDGVGAPVVLSASRERVESAALTPDGRRAIARDADGMVRVWSLAWDDLVRGVRDAVAPLR